MLCDCDASPQRNLLGLVDYAHPAATSVMPAGSPIGSGQGVLNPNNIRICLEYLKENDPDYPVIIAPWTAAACCRFPQPACWPG